MISFWKENKSLAFLSSNLCFS